MRRLWIAIAPAVLLILVAGAAGAQVSALDAAASALRGTPVYIDTAAERATDVDVNRLLGKIRQSDHPIFVAVLPGSVVNDAGGNVNNLPAVLGRRAGLQGTYAVVAGTSFRADSNDLPPNLVKNAATKAFQDKSKDGVGAVLELFVQQVNQIHYVPGGSPSGGGASAGGGGSGGVLLLLLAAGGGGIFLWYRSRAKRRRESERKEMEADRQLLSAELSVLGSDVIELEPHVTMQPDARPDYDAGVTRFKSAQAALEYADEPVDLVRVERVIDEGRYAMERARAHIDGRQPPAPPEKLSSPGRRGEPALEIDHQGTPAYVGGQSWYGGGGWFGGGNGLLTGLLLGQMLGGGWGGGYYGGGYGGGYGSGGDGDGGNDGGGNDDAGGDWGGGDFGGGDFGGGDFGGGGDF